MAEETKASDPEAEAIFAKMMEENDIRTPLGRKAARALFFLLSVIKIFDHESAEKEGKPSIYVPPKT